MTNIQKTNSQILYREVERLREQIARNARYGGSNEKRVDSVIECLGLLQRLADEYPGEIAIEWVAEQGTYLALSEGLALDLRDEIRSRVFDWLHRRGTTYFGGLRIEAMTYFWCERNDLGIKNRAGYRNYQTGGDPTPEPIFSDVELDDFYAEDPMRIWRTLANEVCPRYNLYLKNPFVDAAALQYYRTYKKALTIPVGEITIPNDSTALT